MKRGTKVLLALLLLPLGCRHSESTRTDSLGRSGLPQLIRKLRESNGGVEAWKQHAAVRFSYAVELGGHKGRVVFPEVAFRLDDYRQLWARWEGDPQLVRLRLGESPRIRGSLALGFALSSIPYFFCLPLASATGTWEFRSLIAPRGTAVPAEFETVPQYPMAPIGPCLIQADLNGDPLAKIVYKGKHPFLAARPHSLEFQDYKKVRGVEIAQLRTHTVLERQDFDPFAEKTLEKGTFEEGTFEEESDLPAWILRETLGRIVFLSQEEADQRYPAVDPEDEAP